MAQGKRVILISGDAEGRWPPWPRGWGSRNGRSGQLPAEKAQRVAALTAAGRGC
jgi:Cu2+-exporting ATPase